MKAAVEHHFNGSTAPLTGSYDSTKTLIASLLRQASGSNAEDNYISTKASAMANLPEFVVAAQHMPHVYKWSNNIYWIFAMSAASATQTRTITLTEFNSTTSTLNYKGYITLSGTTIAGTKIGRSLRAFVYEHTTGTVSTSGASTNITGNSTQFTTERIAVGARIGFGTTDPTQVTTWYEVTAIANDTSLTINSPVTLSAGTSYVIEEIRIAMPVTVSSVAIIQGGMHLIKGINYNTFTNGGTTILESSLTTPSNTDNLRASYFLTEGFFSGSLGSQTVSASISAPCQLTASNHGLINSDPIVITTTGATPTGLTATTTTATIFYVISSSTNNFQVSTTLNGTALTTTGTQSGIHTMHYYPRMATATIAADDFVSNTQHDVYLVGSLTNAVSIIKYNIRAALTVGALGTAPNITGGTSPSAFSFRTATIAVTGTPSQLNSGRIFTVAHGPGSGSKSLYFATTTRIYRCPLSQLFAGSTSYLFEAMQEVPPGGLTGALGNVYTVLGSMAQVDYSSTIDRLFIPTTSGRLGTYVTQFATNPSTTFDKIVGSNLNRVRFSNDSSGASDGVFPQATLTIWTEDGWMFAIPTVITSGQNWLYVWPFGADAYYNSTSNQHIITPKLATPNASKLYHVYVDHQEYAGTYGLGFPVETYKLWYRTSGIDDNSGAWTEVPVGADMQNVTPGDYIQFKIAFDIMGEICVPTRIYSICCTYEDKSQDSHYEPSLTKSSAQNRQFAWRQISSWGGTIPNLRIRLFNVVNNATVLDDDITSNTYGTWQYSTDGTNWSAWSSSADTIGNYIRYTADDGIIGNLITVRALLTQA